MKKIRLHLGKRSYDIIIGEHAIKNLGKELKKLEIGSDAYVLTNRLINNKYGCLLKQVLLKAGFSCHFKLIATARRVNPFLPRPA